MPAGVVGIDLGGTRIKAAVVRAGTLATEVVVRSAPRDLDGALRTLSDVRAALDGPADGPVAGVGVAVPGLVGDDGRVQALPGKYAGIVGFDLPGWLQEEFGAPAIVRNDAVGYALGEALHGAGRGARRVLVVTIGTGVGVGVIDDGRPVSDGPFGGGIMGGNVLISAEDPRYLDTADRAGTVEARCRADRIVDYAAEAGGEFPDVPAVLAAYARGDSAAVAGVERYREWLARGLAALAVAHGADRVVVGGGPLTGQTTVLDGVETAVRRHLWPSHELSVVPAQLGDGAALLGMARLVVDLVGVAS